MRGIFGALADGLADRKAQALDWIPEFLLAPAAKSGISVNYDTALQTMALLGCARVIAEGVAQSPCKLLRPRADGKGAEAATDHSLYQLLYLEPRSGQTAYEFWETILLHRVIARNAYVFKNYVGGRIFELIILEPGLVQARELPDRSVVYDVTGRDGRAQTLTRREVWHLRGLSWNGSIGLPVIKLAKEAIGLSLALEEAHARLHGNGVQPAGFVSVPGIMDEANQQKLTGWIKRQAAAANRFNPLVLDQGAAWVSQQMTGVDSQHLETRRFQIEEICRATGVIPLMVFQSDKTATYASVEQLLIAHVMHTLGPNVRAVEQSVQVHLLSDQEKAAGLYLKFYLQALMRGDYKGRQEGLQIQRRNGVINADEWRLLEDMNPREDEGGGQYLVEANMAIQDGRDLPPPSAQPSKPKD
jgi:HK97 family phage portal protein